jgi:eukaryotic-like serine/threonine-protein kinase
MITSGTRLGTYEVLLPLGAGGMGEVYRARDTRLGRDVALKILPPLFSQNPERLARFEREAQLLAALNHPHIGAIYGLEKASDTHFLVLELVEGDTLATRIAAGALPLNEALRIGREIIDALEAAHDKGIIHRDLKPSNIALTADGHVKVLDFGLAKATDPVISGSEVSPIGVTYSPTLTLAATQAGVILGTAAYMSPEQAKGRVADKRSDVWAFGCVLFEMLSGVRVFDGEDASDTMAAVLRGEPAWQALPAGVPLYLREILRRCLDKDRRTRIPDFSVIRFLLDDGGRAAAAPVAVPPTTAPSRTGRLTTAFPWAAAVVAVVVAAIALVNWAPWRSAPVTLPTRVNASIGVDDSLFTDVGSAAAFSPDGRLMVMTVAGATSPPHLVLRRLDQLLANTISNSEGGVSPFFSPDSQWIAFFAGGKLKKVSVNGGAAVTLADASQPRGGTWTDDGFIIFAASSTGGLSRVSDSGGPVEEWTKLTEGDVTHRWPDAVPGGRVIFTSTISSAYGDAQISVRDPDGTVRRLLRGATFGRYAASGHILYLVNNALFSVPFDASRGEVVGAGVPVIDAVTQNAGNGSGQFTVSRTGTVAYLGGDSTAGDTPIQWLDQTGKTSPLRTMPANWSNPSFSPDGRRLAIDISDGTQSDIWIYDWERDTLSRLTFDPTDDLRPVWTPDGTRIAYSSRRGDKQNVNLWWQRADGTGEPQRLTDSVAQQTPSAFGPGGRILAFDEVSQGSKTARDLMMLPIEGDDATGWKAGTPTVFLQTPQNEGSAMFSPDGRWVAYISNETGGNEVYVRPYPGPGGKWQISTGGGDDPTWAPARSEFFFASNDNRLMVAPFSVSGASFQAEKPRVWTDKKFVARPRPPSRDVAIHPDGKRFALASAQDGADEKIDQIVIVFDFFDELRRAAKPPN